MSRDNRHQNTTHLEFEILKEACKRLFKSLEWEEADDPNFTRYNGVLDYLSSLIRKYPAIKDRIHKCENKAYSE